MKTHIFKWRAYIVVLALLCSVPLNAQIETQLPDGFGLGGLQTSENLSSGVLNFNLPIENAVTPISIGYATTGIRVSQRPGELGLGWNLQVGGFIAREKRGRADDHFNGYSGSNQRGNTLSTLSTNLSSGSSPSANDFNDFYKNNFDAQPDMFQYSFLGQSGKFVISANREIIHLSPTTLKVQPIYSASYVIEGFDIWDANGNHYEFLEIETIDTKELDSSNQPKSSSAYNDYYTHKWYLSKVQEYATGDYTFFDYLPYTNNIYSEVNTHVTRNMVGSTQEGSPNSTKIRTTVYKKLINSITKGKYSVQFTYGNRADLIDRKKLDQITVSYNYVQANSNDFNISYDFKYKYLGGNEERLMLAGVTKSDLDVSLYQFVYYGEGSGEPTLPDYTSKSQDHWGFYNNNPSSSLFGSASRAPILDRTRANSLKKIIHTTGMVEEFQFQLNSYVNSSSNVENVGGLRIHKIIQGDVEGNNQKTVKEYLYNDYYSNFTVKSATSGEVFNEPLMRYVYRVEGTTNSYEVESEFSHERLNDSDGRHIAYKYVKVKNLDGSYTINQFKTFSDRADLHDFPYEYSSRGVRAITTSGTNKNWKSPEYFSNLVHPGPFAPLNTSGQFVGLPEEVRTFDKNDNPVSVQDYVYEKKNETKTIEGFSFLTVASLKRFLSTEYDHEVLYQGYELSNAYLRLERTISRVFPTNSTSMHETLTTYTYDTHYPLITEEESVFTRYLSNLSTYIDQENRTKVKRNYLFRQSGQGNAVTQNLLSLVSSQESYKNNELLASTVNNYVYDTGSEKYSLDNTKTYRAGALVSETHYAYDEGLPVEVFDALSGKYKSYVYDEAQRPTAEIGNAKHQTVAYTGFESNDDLGNWTFNTNSLGDYAGRAGKSYRLYVGQVQGSALSGEKHILSYWKKGGTIARTGMPGAQLLQSYTENGWTYEEWSFTGAGALSLSTNSSAVYIDDLRMYQEGAVISTTNYHPIFGVTAEADHNNNVIKYDYDDVGRQTYVKDQNNNVLEATEYNIADFLVINKRNNYFGYFEGVQTVDITSNTGWTISGLPSWITTSRTTGENIETIDLNIARNNNTSSGRTANISFTTDNGVTKSLTITQAQGETQYLNLLSSSNINLSSNGLSAAPVVISSNVAWTATITQGSGNLLLRYDDGLNQNTSHTYSGFGEDIFEVILSQFSEEFEEGDGFDEGGGSSLPQVGRITITANGLPSIQVTINYTVGSSN